MRQPATPKGGANHPDQRLFSKLTVRAGRSAAEAMTPTGPNLDLRAPNTAAPAAGGDRKRGPGGTALRRTREGRIIKESRTRGNGQSRHVDSEGGTGAASWGSLAAAPTCR